MTDEGATEHVDERVGRVCGNGICLAWWPKLNPVTGWHHVDGASFANSANVQVPDGFTFSNAETVIYARALYKPRNPETTSLEVLIQHDRAEFLKEDSSIEITKLSPLKTKDGKPLETYTFFPKSKGNWEEVSYGGIPAQAFVQSAADERLRRKLGD